MKLETMDQNEAATWNPMQEDYENPQFNSFLQGPGKRLASNPNAPSEFHIIVQNLQPGLTDQALLNIFSKFGPVQITYRGKCNRQNDLCVAYLKYKNQISANRAIKEVDKEPPFFMRVKHSQPKENRNRPSGENFDNLPNIIKKTEAPVTEQPEPDNVYTGPKLEEIRSSFFLAEHPFEFITNDNFDPIYCNPFLDFHLNKYKIYPVVDKLYSKAFEMGNKRVTLGRGYYMDEEKKSIKPGSTKSFKFGKCVESTNSEVCELCSKKGFYSCKSCHMFYCSRECQVQDWPKHALICSDLAKAKRDDDGESLVSLKVTHVESDHIYAIKKDALNRFETLQMRLQEESPKQYRIGRLVKGAKCVVLDEDKNEWCRGVVAQLSAPVHSIFFIDYGYTRPCISSSVRHLHPDLSVDTPFALKIKLVAKNGYSVVPGSLLKVSSFEIENGLYKAVLKEVCESVETKSVCGSVMSSRRIEMFGKTHVNMVDLSFEEFTEVSLKSTVTTSTYFVSWKSFDFSGKPKDVCGFIQIDDIQEDYYPVGTKLKVRSISRLGSDFFCVETESYPVLEQHESNGNCQKPMPLAQFFKKEDTGKIIITCIQRTTSFLALVSFNKNENLPFLKKCEKVLFHTFQDKMNKLSLENDFVPEIGDCVAVYDESSEIWGRGIVWSVSSSKLARAVLVDFGRVISVPVKNVRPLDAKYKVIPPLTVHCSVKTIKSEKKFSNFLNSSEKKFDFVVEEESSNGVVTCSLTDGEEEICLLEILDWNPTAEDVGLKAVQLKNHSEVKLTQFYSSSHMYVTPVNQANFMVDQKLVKLIQSAQPMKRIPRFGELVACKWSKNNQYYRAQILEPFKNSQYRIFFVDSGTQEVRNLGDIFELDDELKSYPCLAVKICLKDIDNELIVHHKLVCHLNTTALKEESLKIVFKNDDLSAVELISSNNSSMNERLNHFMTSEDIDSNDEIYSNEILYVKLEIGADVELGLLRFTNGFVMLEPKSDAAQFVFDTLHYAINEYCESLSNRAYYPREGEVVFAQINTKDAPEKCWCRATVLKNEHLGSTVVQCLDYGGIGDILHTSIRKMHPKFMEVPAVAYFVIPRLPKNLSSSQIDTLNSSFKCFSTYSCKVVSRNDFQYCVDVKFSSDVLKQS